MTRNPLWHFAGHLVFTTGCLLGTSIEARAQTPGCPPPTALTIRAVTANTATVSFLGSSAALQYVVRAVPTAGGTTATVSGFAAPLTLVGLVPGTRYTITVAATCDAGHASAASSAVPVATLPAGELWVEVHPDRQTATLVVPAALLRQAGLLTLRDAAGRVVRQQFVAAAAGGVSATHAEFSLAGLPAGVYWLRLLSSQGPLTQQLVVE